jgi:hypothetical protein
MKYLLSFFCLAIFSCSSKESKSIVTEEVKDSLPYQDRNSIGYLAGLPPPPKKPIKPSKTELLFSVQGGNDSVYMNSFWELPFIEECKNIEAATYYFSKSPNNVILIKDDYCNNNYCENIEDRVYGYIRKRNKPIMKIECPWFSIKKSNGIKMNVSVNKNKTGKERIKIITIGLVDFSIIQTAE